MKGERVTIKTIAEAVGVTHGTVSRALRGDSRVKAETAEAIKEAVERLGYQPSRLARALKTRRTGSLAIVVSYITDPFYSEVIQAVHDRLFNFDYSLFMAGTEFDDGRQQAVARSLSQNMVDGVFVCCLPGMTEPFMQLSRQIPVVTINCDPQKYPYGVIHDDAGGMEKSLEHLLELGHHRVGYLGSSSGGFAEQTRRRAFLEYGQQMALKTTLRSCEDVKVEAGEAAMSAWIAEGELPGAIVCFNDTVAIGAMRAARKAGLSVPGDLSLLGFDDIEMAAYTEPPLTTYRQPRYAMGKAAAEMLLSLINGQKPTAAQRFSGELTIRESCGYAV